MKRLITLISFVPTFNTSPQSLLPKAANTLILSLRLRVEIVIQVVKTTVSLEIKKWLLLQ